MGVEAPQVWQWVGYGGAELAESSTEAKDACYGIGEGDSVEVSKSHIPIPCAASHFTPAAGSA